LGGIDLHHVIDAMKLFNPSEGVNKTIDESLKENRKLVPLCKKCHILIHHKDGENDRFMKTLKSKYGVDASLEDGQLFRIPR
jgi:predicted HNH restriction endonuclease